MNLSSDEKKLIIDSLKKRKFNLQTGFFPQDMVTTNWIGEELEKIDSLIKKLEKKFNNL